MFRLQYILKSANVINLILAVILLFFILLLVLPLFEKDSLTPLPSSSKGVAEKKGHSGEPDTIPGVSPEKKDIAPDISEFTVIAEQNLFHPDRTLTEGQIEVSGTKQPRFVLYGTVIDRENRIAFIEDTKTPYSTPGRGKRQRTLKIGERLSGYLLEEVRPDSVIMVRGSDRIEIKVADNRDRNKTGQPAKPPAVLNPFGILKDRKLKKATPPSK
jgi:hypothetical protein